MGWLKLVVNWKTETFQLICQEHIFDGSANYENWCNGFGVSEPAIVQADLHPLDPSIKELYFPYNQLPTIRWKKGIHKNPFQGWKVKSKPFKSSNNLASTIKHLKLYDSIKNKTIDIIISDLKVQRRYNKTYKFKLREGDREFENLISKLHQKFSAGNTKQRCSILELLIEQSPTTFLSLWAYSNGRGNEIQNYIYP